MKNNKGVSVVLGSYNRLKFLKLTIESIRKELTGFNHEIIVVDGGSDDGTMQWLVGQKDVISIIQHNRGSWKGEKINRRSWGYFMNLGLKCAQGEYVCMLNDDCLVVPGAIVNGVNFFEEKIKNGEKIGAVAFYWRNWPLQKKYFKCLTLGNKLFVCFGLFLKQALEDVGYIEENNYTFYCADADLCLKMWQKGLKCIESPNSYIEHFPHANVSVRKTNAETFEKDLQKYLSQWRGIFCGNETNNAVNWIEKDFEDKTHTAKKFMKVAPFYSLFLILKERCKPSIKKILQVLGIRKFK